jgi:predicted ABC-type transport system involved in lysophospholipase L1 biosynthesis ATPase subunit
MTILIVTHNNELAAQTPRKLRMADGRITDEA